MLDSFDWNGTYGQAVTVLSLKEFVKQYLK